MNRNIIIMLGLGAGVAAALMNRGGQEGSISPAPGVQPSAEPIRNYPQGLFPLKLGSRGDLVKDLQGALLKKGGAPASEISRSGGADGIFGRGTERALRAAGFSSTVSKSDYELLLGIASKRTQDSSFDAYAVAAAAQRYNENIFSTADDAVRFLRLIGNPRQYQAVSERVKQWSGGRSLLEIAFNRVAFGKDKIRNEFSRMGLMQNSDGTWTVPTLNGLGSTGVRNVMAISPTSFEDGKGTKHYTDARNVLGIFMKSHKGVTYFMQDGEIYSILSSKVVKI